MLKLSWDIQELTTLNDMGQHILVECQVLTDKLNDPVYNAIEDNLARRLLSLRQQMITYVKPVSRYRRNPASHLLVIMISTEDRRRKPYAMPVQCIAYRSLKDAKVRSIGNKVVQEMHKRGMYYRRLCSCSIILHPLLGFTTNGEWNSLRAHDNTRPLSVLQLRSIARSKYCHMGYQKMMGMITPRGKVVHTRRIVIVREIVGDREKANTFL